MHTTRLYKGDYRDRQNQANRDSAVCYLEHHFNSSPNSSAGYAVVIVASNASATSREWGRWYAHRIAEEFGIPVGGDDGIRIGGYGGRGDGNLRHTKMPAILVEPLFASNPAHARVIKSEQGIEKLAGIVAESVRKFFPCGGLVAFSVGHKYKRSAPNDCGATVVGGGTEADYADLVLERAAEMLGEQ
jgi:N-acetylmuramoyl-L-alanine amidase